MTRPTPSTRHFLTAGIISPGRPPVFTKRPKSRCKKQLGKSSGSIYTRRSPGPRSSMSSAFSLWDFGRFAKTGECCAPRSDPSSEQRPHRAHRRRLIPSMTMANSAASRAGSPLPQWIRPQLSELVDAAPEGEGWFHEIKFDGYRMHARLDHGAVKLLTRTGLDWTHKYPPIARAVAALGARQAYLDGELCGVGPD